MMNIFYLNAAGLDIFADPTIRSVVGGGHAWCPEGQTWSYGVCTPKHGVPPEQVVDALIALKLRVLPSVHDTTTAVHADIHKHLAGHGVVTTDNAFQVATKMHKASGFPPLRPHLY